MAYKKTKKTLTPEQKAAKNDENIAKAVQPVLDMIESGVAPWRKRFVKGSGTPVNAVTGEGLSGGNFIHALFYSMAHGEHRFATYAQWKKVGGQVRKGSAGKGLFLLRPLIAKDKEDPDKSRCFGFSGYTVFPMTMVDGVDESKLKCEPITEEKRDNDPIAAAEAFFGLHKIEIKDSVSPAYSPKNDTVFVPEIGAYESSEAYYQDLAHEVGHWTGAENRMNRDGIKSSRFGSEKYSKEELVAELFACLVRQHCEFETEAEIKDSASYLSNWLSKLQAEPKMLWDAGSQAHKAFKAYLDKWPNSEKKAMVAKVAA